MEWGPSWAFLGLIASTMVEEASHGPFSNQNTHPIVGYKEMPVISGLGTTPL